MKLAPLPFVFLGLCPAAAQETIELTMHQFDELTTLAAAGCNNEAEARIMARAASAEGISPETVIGHAFTDFHNSGPARVELSPEQARRLDGRFLHGIPGEINRMMAVEAVNDAGIILEMSSCLDHIKSIADEATSKGNQ